MGNGFGEGAVDDGGGHDDEGEYDEGAVLRIGVTGGGCSGFNYALNIAADFDAVNDSKSEQHQERIPSIRV